MDRLVFSGSGLNGIDGKNRLSIPSDFRAALARHAPGSELLIGPATGLDCLIAYDAGHRLHMLARMDDQGIDGDTAEGAMQAMARFGSVQPFTIDDNGRIVLSATLKTIGGFGGHVWFIAAGRFFQMWNPYRFLEAPGLDPKLARLCRAEMSAKGLPAEEPA